MEANQSFYKFIVIVVRSKLCVLFVFILMVIIITSSISVSVSYQKYW